MTSQPGKKNSSNTRITKYLEKKRRSGNEIWSDKRI